MKKGPVDGQHAQIFTVGLTVAAKRIFNFLLWTEACLIG